MVPPVIDVESLTKVYRAYPSPFDRLLEAVLRRPRHREFRALDQVSFDLASGEGLGIIGENGAGKSTLLKILAGITPQTAGEVRVRGKVAAILELGSAFHPELTGRQNIVLNAAMLGLSEDEVRARTPDILTFSELGEFIDQPVKVYSTGMAMRLGFSIATQVDPDILIIDEALSVGDGYFQKKCLDRLLALVASGTTILFCSHAMYYLAAFCRRALWLRHGKVAAFGPTEEVVREYEAFLQARSAPGAAAQPATPAMVEPVPSGRAAEGAARIVHVEQQRGTTYRHGDPWTLLIEWETPNPELAFHVAVGVNRVDEVEVLAFATSLDGLAPLSGRKHYSITLEVPELPIVRGAFTLYVFLLDEASLHIYDRQVLHGILEVKSEQYRFGLVEAAHRWFPAASATLVGAP